MIQSFFQIAKSSIDKLTDESKVDLIGYLLEGGFDNEDVVEALSDTVDAYAAAYKGIQNIFEDAPVDDDYDGGRFDWETSRGVS